jgi:hypothetical protein
MDIGTARTYGCSTLRITESNYALPELFLPSFLKINHICPKDEQPKDCKHNT